MGFRIAIGALLFEGNTLSPVVSGLQDFHNKYFHCGPSLIQHLRDGAVEMSGAISVLESNHEEIIPLLATHGGAGGRVSSEAYLTLKELLLGRLKTALPLDGLYLALHGAFISQEVDDVEGEILEEARDAVGDIPLIVSCDLHAHITDQMMDLADMIVGYQTYPHADASQTGGRCAQLLLRTIRGEIEPAMRHRKAPMIVPPPNSRTAGEGPMSRLNRWARDREEGGAALAVSYFPVQPWLDLPDVGFTGVVITDRDSESADRLASELCREAWKRRLHFEVELVAPSEAIRRGLEVEGRPVVLADTADCVGGGASGDSAVVLEALLDSGMAEYTAILIVDPETASEASGIGEGGHFRARIGNKRNPIYGEPVEADAEVRRLFDGDFSYKGGIMAGPATMGPSALLQVGPVEVVVSSFSSYEYADEQFLAAGVDPRQCKFVVVKNPMNYRTAYPDAAEMMVLDTPGPTSCNLAAIPWKHITRPRYPIDKHFEPCIK